MNHITFTTHFQHLVGLMLRKHPTIAILEYPQPQIIPIHTWFMFYTINLYYLNENYDLIETKQNLRPFSHYTPRNKSIYVVEVPS